LHAHFAPQGCLAPALNRASTSGEITMGAAGITLILFIIAIGLVSLFGYFTLRER